MRSRITVAVVTLFVIAVLVFSFLGNRDKATSSIFVGSYHIAVNEVVEYASFFSCRFADGTRVYDVHFGGVDRLRPSHFVRRVNDVGHRTLQVVTNDPTLPKGNVRLVHQTVTRYNLDEQNRGVEWTAEFLQINPRRPIERAVNIPPCGPERQ